MARSAGGRWTDGTRSDTGGGGHAGCQMTSVKTHHYTFRCHFLFSSSELKKKSQKNEEKVLQHFLIFLFKEKNIHVILDIKILKCVLMFSPGVEAGDMRF